jgi:polysaccharide biosynthesis/export protein
LLKEPSQVRVAALFVALALAAVSAACSVSAIDEGAFGAVAAPVDSSQPVSTAHARPQDSGAIERAAQTYTAMADPKSKAYQIGPLDVLEVTVFKVPDLCKSVQVSEAGTITFPLIGEVQAGGKSARELEQELKRKLGARYLRNPQITVFVKDYNSQRVTVSGAVKKPGVVAMAGGMTLMQAIASSGGLDELAESTAVIFRANGDKRTGHRYDLSELEGSQGGDPQLLSGDVILVPVSNIKYGTNLLFRMAPLASVGMAPLR